MLRRLFSLAFYEFENILTARLLRSPTFNRGVRRIHRTVEELRHGRDPNEPLRQGEATADPNRPRFLKLFIEELRNQIRPPPTAPPPVRQGGATADPDRPSFMKLFIEELRNQIRPPPPPPPR